ncbi:MAG: hypothetical protein PSN04_03010 [Methyloprofundus sp.]|nr:hypothetical protein [Methyloprofundus sp.]
MSENADKITLAYENLRENMPPIGILSRKKRIKGYIEITNLAEYMITSGEISVEDALFVLSMLMRKFSRFQKAASMTAMSLESIGRKVMSPIGVRFAVAARRNLNLSETPHYQDVPSLEEEQEEVNPL